MFINNRVPIYKVHPCYLFIWIILCSNHNSEIFLSYKKIFCTEDGLLELVDHGSDLTNTNSMAYLSNYFISEWKCICTITRVFDISALFSLTSNYKHFRRTMIYFAKFRVTSRNCRKIALSPNYELFRRNSVIKRGKTSLNNAVLYLEKCRNISWDC